MDARLEAVLVVLGYIVLLELMVVVLIRSVAHAIESPRPAAVAGLIALAGGWLVLVIGLGYVAFSVFPISALQ